MPRRKQTVRDRFPEVRNWVTIRCRCGHRLGLAHEDRTCPGRVSLGLWFVPAQHGTYVAGEEPGRSKATHGIQHIAFDDWVSVSCSACGHVWQGRDAAIEWLVRLAWKRGAASAELTDERPPPPMVDRLNVSSGEVYANHMEPTSERW